MTTKALFRQLIGLAAAVCCLLSAAPALAYSGAELRDDCQAADARYREQRSSDPYDAIRGARCIAYLAGFADSYAISDYLADKVGVRLNAFCLPKEDDDLSMRLVRAVVIHLERMPPNASASTAILVAGALAKAFPCPEALEPKK